jgi:hypothetical protein
MTAEQVFSIANQFPCRRDSLAVAVQPNRDQQLGRPRRSSHLTLAGSNSRFVPAQIQPLGDFPDSARRMLLLNQVLDIDLRHRQLVPLDRS